MDIKSLYTAVTVADFGSFANAAKALSMSISAVSIQIRGLETELGFALFDRSSRPPVITEQGRLFMVHAREMLAQWERLSENLSRDIRGGILRVGAVHTAVSGSVPPALKRLRQRQPDLHIQLTTGLSHELEEKLRRGTLDAVIVTEADEFPDIFTYRRFAEEPLVVICHRDVRGNDARQILEANPYLRFNRQARVGQLIDRAIAERGIAVRSQMEIDTLDGVVALVHEGLGVSVVPLRPGSKLLPERVRSVAFEAPPPTRRLGLVELKTNPRAHLADMLFAELSSGEDRKKPRLKS
ncbi:MAG: LysR family transcriptional regulator [Rhodomicrobiaceae bacterium]